METRNKFETMKRVENKETERKKKDNKGKIYNEENKEKKE